MTDLVEKALLSDDSALVKKIRGFMGSQISCDVNLLGTELSKKTGPLFLLANISPNLIKIQKENLMTHFDAVQKLHNRYIILRSEGTNEETEKILAKKDIEYMEHITLKVCPILDKIEKYEEALSAENKKTSLEQSLVKVRLECIQNKKDFKIVYDMIKSEIDSIEALQDKSEAKSEIMNTLPT